ncbi:hypothetical protein IAT40_006813 [Kwoniella sp. CBS 6097]
MSGPGNMKNVTVDDPSERIDYQGDWDGTVHKGDPFVNRYSNSTFHASNTNGDSVTFEWDGACIWLFGAKRPNHGNFSVSLDGGDKQYYTSESGPSSDLFQQVLYTSGEIPSGEHEVVMVNEKGYEGVDAKFEWLDLDFIIYQSDEEAAGNAEPFITTGTPQVPMLLPTGKNPVISISSSASTSKTTPVSLDVMTMALGAMLLSIMLVKKSLS